MHTRAHVARLGALAALWMTLSCSSPARVTGDAPPTGTPEDPAAPSLAQATQTFNDAVQLAAADAVVGAGGSVTLQKTVTVGDATVAFDHLMVHQAPLSFTGDATLVQSAHDIHVVFSGGTVGAASLDGQAWGALEAQLPMTPEFAAAIAAAVQDACATTGTDPALAATAVAAATGGTCDFDVIDNGDGTFTIKGSCDVGGVAVDVEIDVDPVNGTVSGKITIDDGTNVIVIDI